MHTYWLLKTEEMTENPQKVSFTGENTIKTASKFYRYFSSVKFTVVKSEIFTALNFTVTNLRQMFMAISALHGPIICILC